MKNYTRFDHCEEILTDVCITCKEKKRKLPKVVFQNPARRQVSRITVDGCAITKGPRCDYMVVARGDTEIEEIYVELKGSDIDHAIRQLEATIGKLSHGKARLRKMCYIASKCCPQPISIKPHKDRFRHNFNAKLVVKSNLIEHTFA